MKGGTVEHLESSAVLRKEREIWSGAHLGLVTDYQWALNELVTSVFSSGKRE